MANFFNVNSIKILKLIQFKAKDRIIMQICVTGANGFIGRYLLEALSRQGYSIRVLTRRERDVFPLGVEVVIGDLTKADCPLDQFLNGCDILFHCAGEIHDTKVMNMLHVEGTKRLIQSVQQEHSNTGRILHWVQLSSVGAYGPPAGGPQIDRIVTEYTENNPANEYEITKTISDELVIRASHSGAMTYSILRPSNVFGTKMTNQSLRRLIKMVKSGLFFYVGKPGAVTTFVHVEDVVAALVMCGTDPRASGQIYNLSHDCKLEELIRHVALLFRLREPMLRIPEPMIRIPLGLLSKLVGAWVSIPKFNVLVIRTHYPTDKIETELGFIFSKSFAARITELVTEFQ